MAAAFLRAQLGRAGVLASIKKPLTFSFCTPSASWTPARFEKNGWEFSQNHCDSDCDRFSFYSSFSFINVIFRLHLHHNYSIAIIFHLVEIVGLEFCCNARLKAYSAWLPQYYSNNSEICIKHLDSGIKFSFNAYDALCKWQQEHKWHQENITRNPLEYDLPTYGSPLLPLIEYGYDSAYVGRVFIEKPDKETQNISVKWEDIDWIDLHEQFLWTIKNDIISGGEKSLRYLNYYEGINILTDEDIAARRIFFKLKGYLYCEFSSSGNSSCYFSLVVSEYGWFFCLQQCLESNFGDIRSRHMTMHCNFEETTIYREITEYQSDDFERRFPIAEDVEPLENHIPYPHFHEVKKFKVQGAHVEESCSWTVKDAKRYTSFTVDEWKAVRRRLCGLFNPKIKSLFADCGKELRSIEKKTDTRIQIVPLFQKPRYSHEYIWEVSADVFTSVYILDIGPSVTHTIQQYFV